MVESFLLDLSQDQLHELSQARDHHPKAYLRVKAAAILKVASGLSMRWVALHELLKPISEETVSRWVCAYQSRGIQGLQVQAGRGRKPAFFPSGTRRRVRQTPSGRASAS